LTTFGAITPRSTAWVVVLATMMVAAGCALRPAATPPAAVYDLGAPPGGGRPTAPTPHLRVADVTAPAWLQGAGINYRLRFSDPWRLERYRDSRWVAPPAALLTERLRERLASACTADTTERPPLLVASLEDFEQVFTAPDKSDVVLRLRATLVSSAPGAVTHARSWSIERPAPTPDARGAVRGLAQAVNEASTQVAAWAASLLPPCR
jgi:cholesterol transport system auxiliary component